MNSIACTTGDVAASRVRDAIAARSPKTSEFRSPVGGATLLAGSDGGAVLGFACSATSAVAALGAGLATLDPDPDRGRGSRSEEHTSELQSFRHLVCRLLLEKKNEMTR